MLYPDNMNYYHHFKVAYTIWLDQSISSQLEVTYRKKLTENINNIRSSKNLLIFAGNTTNLYEMTPEQYKTILSNNIRNTYWKAEQSTQLNINREAKQFPKLYSWKKEWNVMPKDLSLSHYKITRIISNIAKNVFLLIHQKVKLE